MLHLCLSRDEKSTFGKVKGMLGYLGIYLVILLSAAAVVVVVVVIVVPDHVLCTTQYLIV